MPCKSANLGSVKIIVFNIKRGEWENQRRGYTAKKKCLTSVFGLRTPVFRLRTPVFRLLLN